MRQVLIKQGKAMLEEVPAPLVEPETVLVRVEYSCISIGTEMSGVRATGLPLWKRALKQPENVKKALAMITSQGLSKASSQISERLTSAIPTGYSAAGVVVAVGSGVEGFRPGDRVACAGAQCAFHAEYICVPKNLIVLVDDAVRIDHASTVTLGAIALQGVRRSSPTLGETFVVIGLGILGQLTAQLLKTNGCRVIGVDLDQDRVTLAVQLGVDAGISNEMASDVEQVNRLTGGIGADGVIITAATPSDAVISTAFKMCRRKGRVVLVGDVGLNLNREDFYQKELDFFISSSYGPGRYDANYEERGLDYPVAYVRWTENRNMAEYLRLVAKGCIRLAPLISTIFPVEEATTAYEMLKDVRTKPLIVLLYYPASANDSPVSRIVANPAVLAGTGNRVRLAVVGVGSFAKGMHLPNIRDMANQYQLHTVISRSGHNALAAAKQFGALNASTDFEAILQDPSIDAILIATRHNLHASMAVKALLAGKHVLVEKPLAMSREELDQVNEFYTNASRPQPILLTGFNRRFSPHARRIKELVSKRTNPMVLNYRMNAGYIPLEHWVHTEEGGGRNIGEACHIYDLFTFLTGSKVTSVTAQAMTPITSYYSATDNFVATFAFADGSIATLTYTASGSRDYPKEQLEVFMDGMTIAMNDFKLLQVTGSKSVGLETRLSEKGQKEELESFAEAIRTGGDWPISLWEQNQATEMAITVQHFLTGQALIHAS